MLAAHARLEKKRAQGNEFPIEDRKESDEKKQKEKGIEGKDSRLAKPQEIPSIIIILTPTARPMLQILLPYLGPIAGIPLSEANTLSQRVTLIRTPEVRTGVTIVLTATD